MYSQLMYRLIYHLQKVLRFKTRVDNFYTSLRIHKAVDRQLIIQFHFALVPVNFTTFPQNLTVNETHPIVVSCDASGFPEPSFTWRKDGQVLSQPKQLSIPKSDRDDAGMYECTASNGVEKDKTANAYVTVQCKSTSHHVIELLVAAATQLSIDYLDSHQLITVL